MQTQTTTHAPDRLPEPAARPLRRETGPVDERVARRLGALRAAGPDGQERMLDLMMRLLHREARDAGELERLGEAMLRGLAGSRAVRLGPFGRRQRTLTIARTGDEVHIRSAASRLAVDAALAMRLATLVHGAGQRRRADAGSGTRIGPVRPATRQKPA